MRSFRTTDTGAVARVLVSAFLLDTFTLDLIVPLAAFSGFAYLSRDIPPVQQVMSRPVFQTTQIHDRNGTLLYELIDPDHGRRILVNLDQLPPSLIAATISVEDPTFLTNPGVDPLSISRAVLQNFSQGSIVSGASTITQQLARNVLFNLEERSSKTLDRKLKEAIFSVELTQTYSKPQILNMYFNEVYYGNLSYGVGAAAESYFGIPASQLDLAQAAMLAGLPQAPSEYDPTLHYALAKARQSYVLDRMAYRQYITQAEADAAKREVLHFQRSAFQIKAPHFVNYVTQ